MAWAADSVPAAGNHHFGKLEHGVVSSRESPVCGQGFNAGILEIPDNDFTKLPDFLIAGLVPLDARARQQVFPSNLHPRV